MGRIKSSGYGRIRSRYHLQLSIFFTITFLYVSRKWFMTSSVLISERLIFLKLVFKAFWSRFQSDKHLLNIEKQPYFPVLQNLVFSVDVY